ncbi:T9SS type B sorting domain-containing protein [Flavobacterium sufflavum]|uniref:T9SS type B sorting domain-containing protein n=1 Tax=Flavobacterium sufflavum TaxID=1921138 RepID=A0A3S2U3Q2_9FLAO|nr:choice-of-anchor L domain-containing protein [Flavobacterium sufflavum]RVT77393.1 T9SS type B sorting domain-containing protein [Flavobacterium sufflavum]
MKVLQAIFLGLLLCCFNSQLQAQAIGIDDTKNALELVNLLTNNSSCIKVSNESVSGDSFTAGKNSYGSFTNSSPNFPFQSGVVLSTWSSTQSAGPFVRDQGNNSNLWLGDSDLNQALNINSFNASVLEFDFTPLTNTISFNYFFASNEYQDDYPCKYSDGFAFLIKEKGSSTAYQNLAVIPGTTTPVSSKNIHPIINFSPTQFCPANNESYFGQFNNQAANTSPINYAGQTKVLNATANVIAGNTYHIKLVIGDDRNTYYDSAIFIEAASFNSVIDLGSDRLLATNNAVCFGQDYTIDTKLPANYSYKWYKDGILLTSENSPSYTVKSPGTYKVEVTLNPSSCVVTNDVKIEYTPETVLKSSSIKQCDIDEDGKAVFDLTQADSEIKNNNSGLSDVSYYENLTDAQAGTNPILNSSNYINKSNPQILIARATNPYSCFNYAELTLELSNEIIPSRIATITEVKTTDFAGNKNTAIIEYTGSSDYEFSIDGNFYQDSPEFSNIAPGSYLAYAREKNGCNISNPFLFYILDYPHYFTPNGDGYNDTWTIKNLNLLPQATINIFNRYGKLLKQFKSPNLNWNGTANGYLLPADDYWFSLIFENGKNIKGHFSLKR